MASAKDVEFAPLLEALDLIQSQTGTDFSHLIVAAPSMFEMGRQKLPGHSRVIRKERFGLRVPVRGRRHHYEPRLHLAVWPEDAMAEGAVPSLAYVLKGEADFQVADYALCCRAGDCIMFPAGVPKQDGSHSHFEGGSKGRFGEVLWIYTGADRTGGLSCWICRSQGEECTKPDNASCRVEHRFLAQLFNAFCSEVLRAEHLTIASKILELILSLLRIEIADGNALKDWGRPRYQGKSGESGPIAEALAYIEENLDERLTIGKVAREVILSPATFTRLFKQETGETFQKYQTRHRMEVAERLLTTTNQPISYVCRRVGLKYGQLRALFQKTHGCSPGEFRHRKTLTS